MNTTGRLTRSNTDKVVAGVCGGIANYLNVDPTLVRLAFVLLVWLGGVTPFIYLILWAVLPTDSTVGQGFSQQVRENLSEMEKTATTAYGKVSSQVERFVGDKANQVGQSTPPSTPSAQQPDAPATGPTRRL